MMRTRVLYAIKILLEIAEAQPHPKTVKVIARNTGISENYVEQIIKAMNGKMVVGLRGPHGGYVLRVPTREIFIGIVGDLIDGNDAKEDIPDFLKDIESAVLSLLKRLTLADVQGFLRDERRHV